MEFLRKVFVVLSFYSTKQLSGIFLEIFQKSFNLERHSMAAFVEFTL